MYNDIVGRDEKGNEIAVKEIPRNILNEKLLISLKKEAGIMKSFDNPNIVKLHSILKTKRYFYLVMEFCNGGDLNKQIKKHKRFEEHVTQNIIYQVSLGLKALHENNIIHRDLKLSNFLLVIKDGTY